MDFSGGSKRHYKGTLKTVLVSYEYQVLFQKDLTVRCWAPLGPHTANSLYETLQPLEGPTGPPCGGRGLSGIVI